MTECRYGAIGGQSPQVSLGTVPVSFKGESPRKFHFQFLEILRRAKQAEAEAFEDT